MLLKCIFYNFLVVLGVFVNCLPWQLLAVRSGTYDINGKAVSQHFAILGAILEQRFKPSREQVTKKRDVVTQFSLFSCVQIYALGKQATAPPKQAARGHWLTQACDMFTRFVWLLDTTSVGESICSQHMYIELHEYI